LRGWLVGSQFVVSGNAENLGEDRSVESAAAFFLPLLTSLTTTEDFLVVGHDAGVWVGATHTSTRGVLLGSARGKLARGLMLTTDGFLLRKHSKS
jgi:hypothetical protein